MRIPAFSVLVLLTLLLPRESNTSITIPVVSTAITGAGGPAFLALLATLPKGALLGLPLAGLALLRPAPLLIFKALKLALLFKPALLGPLAPLGLLALKKFLLKPFLGPLLLKLPFLLAPRPGLFFKVLGIKAALIANGLKGVKAPVIILLLGAAALGTGVGLAIAYGSALKKLKESQEFIPEVYAAPSYGAPGQSYGAPAAPAISYAAPAAPAISYGTPALYSDPTGYAAKPAATIQPANTLGIAGAGYTPPLGHGLSGSPALYGRRKRDTEDEDSADGGSEINEQNGQAYLYLAAEMDEQGCAQRLLCEVYQKPDKSLTADELLLRDMFGKPLQPLSEEDEDTGKEFFYRAAWLGYTSAPHLNACAARYSSCPYNSAGLLNLVAEEAQETNTVDHGEEEDDDDDEEESHFTFSPGEILQRAVQRIPRVFVRE